MVFAYYNRLNHTQKRIYRESDKVTSIRLPKPRQFHPLIGELETVLRQEHRANTEAVCQRLVDGLTAGLEIAPVRVKVLAARPHGNWGELHGLYNPREDRAPARITVWMRTARQRRVVAYKSFLRTLLHEFGHHLDYTLLKLADSFHTEGFYKRESSLYHQLAGDEKRSDRGNAGASPPEVKQGAKRDAKNYADFRDAWRDLKEKIKDAKA